jgi:hypothetical protein
MTIQIQHQISVIPEAHNWKIKPPSTYKSNCDGRALFIIYHFFLYIFSNTLLRSFIITLNLVTHLACIAEFNKILRCMAKVETKCKKKLLWFLEKYNDCLISGFCMNKTKILLLDNIIKNSLANREVSEDLLSNFVCNNFVLSLRW